MRLDWGEILKEEFEVEIRGKNIEYIDENRRQVNLKVWFYWKSVPDVSTSTYDNQWNKWTS